jgi:hypothetical protein
MMTHNPAHGFWGWLRLKPTHTSRKPATITEPSQINAKLEYFSNALRKQKQGRRIVFLEMP